MPAKLLYLPVPGRPRSAITVLMSLPPRRELLTSGDVSIILPRISRRRPSPNSGTGFGVTPAHGRTPESDRIRFIPTCAGAPFAETSEPQQLCEKSADPPTMSGEPVRSRISVRQTISLPPILRIFRKPKLPPTCRGAPASDRSRRNGSGPSADISGQYTFQNGVTRGHAGTIKQSPSTHDGEPDNVPSARGKIYRKSLPSSGVNGPSGTTLYS